MGGKTLPLIWSPEPSLHDLAAVPFGRRSGSSWRSFSGLFRPLATAPAGFSSSPSRRNLAAWLRAWSAPGLRSAELVPGVTADPLRWPADSRRRSPRAARNPRRRVLAVSIRGGLSGLVRLLATARRASLRSRPGATWRPGCGRDPFRACGLLNWFQASRRPLCGGPAAVPLAAVPVAPGGHSPALFDPWEPPRRASLRGRSGQPDNLAAGVVRSGPAVC